ncbi:hypothetical protein [Segeticoccus rhizosphaerae]|jgi:hypothetical protein|nr:hypothetical protein [Ornithinicoccus soli]
MATTTSDDAEAMIADAALHLSRPEAEAFARELQELHRRWTERSPEKAREADDQGRRSYYAVTYLAAADLVYRQLTDRAQT